MTNITDAFRVDTLSLGDNILMVEGSSDPSTVGYEAPIGSLYFDITQHILFSKTGINDTNWVILTDHGNLSGLLDDDHPQYVKKAGDSMSAPLSLPGLMPTGIKTNNQYGWHDLKGEIIPHSLGLYAAIRIPYINDVVAWGHPPGARGDVTFHLPHDYAPGTDLQIHFHWGHNGTNIAGSFVVNLKVSYARRGPQTNTSQWITPISVIWAINSLNITNMPRYDHHVDDILLSTPGGSASLLNTDDIETDGVVVVNYDVQTIPSITGSSSENIPFIFFMDIHYQTTNIGTVSKDPGFYG